MSEPKFEAGEATILTKINAKLAELGSTAQWLRAPESYPEYEALKGKDILMVDDSKRLLENFAPDLTVATDGGASLIHHDAQTLEELVDEIISANPSILLLDFNLAQDIKGDEVTRALLDNGYTGKIIGFSSEKDTKTNFMKAGATGFIEKSTYEPSDSIRKLADLV